jgi:L-ascorbate metabolism protein UlaG (beta-lactamase superfamily)
MKKFKILTLLLIFLYTFSNAQDSFEKDIIKTSGGALEITFIGHGTLMFNFNDLIIHIDPVSSYTDYSKLPDADIILITHQHGDHLNEEAIDLISKSDTEIIVTEKVSQELDGGIIMKNWDKRNVKAIEILAVPAYNLVHKRDNGSPFHPKGEGNGYVMTFDDIKVYVAGDTENFPEMDDMPQVDVAFLPMNLPYTMTPEMVADAALRLNPKILYPYHFGNTDTDELLKLLENHKGIQVRIRKMN